MEFREQFDSFGALQPTYSIIRFTDQIYKIVHFKTARSILIKSCDDDAPRQQKSYEDKLSQSLSRSRRSILELALCNDWDYFCTFTLSPALVADRFDLDAWMKTFTQWIKDYRKKGFDIAYLLVPERHADGSWHAHGLLRLDSSQVVSFRQLALDGGSYPRDLVQNGYFNWVPYENKFGFCSLGKIRDHVATSFYMTKYMTKDPSRLVTDIGKHTYYCSRNLNRPSKFDEVYGDWNKLDAFCDKHYDFVDTGFTRTSDSLDWSFPLNFLDDGSLKPLFDFDYENNTADPVIQELDRYTEYIQTVLDGF